MQPLSNFIGCNCDSWEQFIEIKYHRIELHVAVQLCADEQEVRWKFCKFHFITKPTMSTALYEPIQKSFGTLPERNGEEKTYKLELPVKANEVLIYSYVTAHGEGKFHRGYFEFSTSQGEKKFTQFLNMATGQGINTVNSANMWFPFGDGTLTIKLVHEEGDKSVAAVTDKDWSEVFVIGYRS